MCFRRQVLTPEDVCGSGTGMLTINRSLSNEEVERVKAKWIAMWSAAGTTVVRLPRGWRWRRMNTTRKERDEQARV